MRITTFFGAVLFAIAAPAGANATTIDFDGVASANSGVNVGNSYVTDGVTFDYISPTASSSLRIFNSSTAGTSYILACDFEGANPCDGNMQIDFGGAVTATSLTSLADDGSGVGGVISAFLNGSLVGTVDILTNATPFDGDLVSLASLGMFDLLIFAVSDLAGLGFTDITFERVTMDDPGGGTPEVPLPAGLPLLLTGLAGLSWLKRKKKAA